MRARRHTHAKSCNTCAILPKVHRLLANAIYSMNKLLKRFSPLNRQVQTHSHLPLLYLLACHQDVTVPAFSSSSLSQTVLFLFPVQLCLIVLSALFSLPPSLSLPPFFFSLFPFSLPPLHYITLALTHHQCLMALLPFVPHGHPQQNPLSDYMWWTSSDTPDEAFVFNCTGAAAFQCNESGHCARGDVGISGKGGTVSEISENYEKAALLCLLLSSTLSLSNIRFAHQQMLWFVS